MDVNDTPRQHHRNENTDSKNNTSSNNNDLLKCTCCRRLLPNRKTVIFNENKYNFNNDIVQASLSMRQTYRNMKEVICKSCHNSLRKGVPTIPVHAFHVQAQNKLDKCLLCQTQNFKHPMKDFSVEHYNENTPLLKTFGKDKNIKELKGKICKVCDSKLQ